MRKTLLISPQPPATQATPGTTWPPASASRSRTRRAGVALAAVATALLFVLLFAAAPGAHAVGPYAQVSAGYSHSCALTSSGGVKCWGSNYYGQLGDGTTTSSPTPVDVVGLASGVAEVSAGTQFTCVRMSAGGVKCWGSGGSGSLGSGATANSPTPVDVTGLGSGVAQLSAAGRHACARMSSGGLKCWGYGSNGELGNGATSNRTTPVDVIGLGSGVAQVVTGYAHTCAVMNAGGLKCWGYGGSGELGNGTTSSSTTPVDATVLVGPVSQVSAGSSYTCALMSAGGLKCWGYGGNGQLGNGATSNSTTPVDVTGLGSGVAQVSAGYTDTCARMTTGGLKCWGNGGTGQLGNGAASGATTPVDVTGLGSGVAQVSTGIGPAGHTCALTSTGGIKCWGSNVDGMLGQGAMASSATPVDVTGLGSAVAQVSAGYSTTCARLSAGGLKCWGYGRNGRLGNGATANSPTPVDVTGLGSGVAQVSPGNGSHICALMSSGGLKCWGYGGSGQLGNGATSDSTTPVDVTGLGSGVAQVSAGGSHTCALMTAGDLKCWGEGGSGRLGNGATSSSAVPVAVDATALAGPATQLSVGDSHACALMGTGGLKCWGNGGSGRLGNGSTSSSSIPVDVVGLGSAVTQVSAGGTHTCARMSTGGATCWGYGSNGELGDGAASSSTTPVAVTGLGSGVAQVSAGGFHTCALMSSGGVKCWGRGTLGQLGNGTTSSTTTPVDVIGLGSGVAQVSAGYVHTCALMSAGGVKCWGDGPSGELGDGNGFSAVPVSVGPAVAGDVPGRPTAVRATAGDRSLVVAWEAPTDTGGSPITSYTAIVTGGSGGSCTALAPSTSCTITGLSNGTAYTVVVTATNGTGTSAASDPSDAVTPSAPADAPPAVAPGAGGASSNSAPRPLRIRVAVSLDGSPVTVGPVPEGASAVSQVATMMRARSPRARHAMARATRRATVRCRITAAGGVRTFRCAPRLAAGRWTLTTRAMDGLTVIAQSTRQVTVRAAGPRLVTG